MTDESPQQPPRGRRARRRSHMGPRLRTRPTILTLGRSHPDRCRTMTRSPRTGETLDALALARSRREAMRRRARRIRRSVAGLAVTLFGVAFLIVYVQLASGHDPALVANAKRRADAATSAASSTATQSAPTSSTPSTSSTSTTGGESSTGGESTTSSESSGEETSSESSSSDSGETSTGSSAVTTSQS